MVWDEENRRSWTPRTTTSSLALQRQIKVSSSSTSSTLLRSSSGGSSTSNSSSCISWRDSVLQAATNRSTTVYYLYIFLDIALLCSDDPVHSTAVVAVVAIIPAVTKAVITAAVWPDVAVFSSDDPAALDEHSAAVVASVGLQADLPVPEEGAGLCQVPHRHLTVLGHWETSEAWGLLAAGALLLTTPVLCHPGEQIQIQIKIQSDRAGD